VTAAVSVGRARTVSECASVRGLVEAHARFELSATVLPADWAERMGELVASARLYLFVARIAGNPIGYATMTRDVSTWGAAEYAHLDCLFVTDGQRDAGIGLLLIDAVRGHARSLGIRELQWQTPPWNEGAIRFYTRLGARQETKERFALSLM